MSELEIIATNDGPYHVRGAVQLRRRDGSVIADITDETWLCRCGKSQDKPFCDSSHSACDFSSRPTETREARQVDAGPVVITVRPDGPYFVEGPTILKSEDGAVLARGSHLPLCRCGSSTGKPFCDASHRAIGFTHTP